MNDLSEELNETPEFLMNLMNLMNTEDTEEDKILYEYYENNISKFTENKIKKNNEMISQAEQWKKENPDKLHDKANEYIASLKLKGYCLEQGIGVQLTSKDEIREMINREIE
jgi:hypothetical protein